MKTKLEELKEKIDNQRRQEELRQECIEQLKKKIAALKGDKSVTIFVLL